MRCAIYARKSTEDDRNEDNKSVTRQIERAKEFIKAKGWEVSEEHIYTDDGISGANFTTRQGLLRMLNSLKHFDVIIMSELSRLGREQTQTSKVLADIYARKVRIFFYLTKEELKFETALDKFMVSAVSFGAELEREKASQRVRDALERKARRGYVSGGSCYGYDNVQVFTQNPKGEQVKSHTEYRVNEQEKQVIQVIYEMYQDGYGSSIIAKTLNGEEKYKSHSLKYFNGKTPPSPVRGKKGTGSWSNALVRSLLSRQRYLGKVQFGQYRIVNNGGAQTREKRTEYLVVDRPDLQIIPQDIWDSVQARLKAVSDSFLRYHNGVLLGRPDGGKASKYLLTGIGRCGLCGGNLGFIGGHVYGNLRYYYYGCSSFHVRGAKGCENSLKTRMELLDDAVLESIKRIVFTPEAIRYTITKALEIAKERQKQNPDLRSSLETEIKHTRQELSNFMVLIASGKPPTCVLDEIHKRESLLKTLEAELVTIQASQDVSELDIKEFLRLAEAEMMKVKDVLCGNVPLARQVLRKLLDGPIQFIPVVKDGQRIYAFEGRLKVGALIKPIEKSTSTPILESCNTPLDVLN